MQLIDVIRPRIAGFRDVRAAEATCASATDGRPIGTSIAINAVARRRWRMNGLAVTFCAVSESARPRVSVSREDDAEPSREAFCPSDRLPRIHREQRSAPTVPKRRILIADGDVAAARHLEQRLIGLGYEVAGIASSEQEAVGMAAQVEPDVLLIEMTRRGDRPSVATADEPQRRKIPTVFILADVEAVHRVRDPDDRQRTLTQNREVRGGGQALSFENRYLCKDGSYRWLRWNAAPDSTHRVIYSVARDVTASKQAEEERERLVEELRAALAEVKTLREILPICSYCRKVRDDGNYWHTVESYISRHTATRFSHGICPSCMATEVESQLGEPGRE